MADSLEEKIGGAVRGATWTPALLFWSLGRMALGLMRCRGNRTALRLRRSHAKGMAAGPELMLMAAALICSLLAFKDMMPTGFDLAGARASMSALVGAGDWSELGLLFTQAFLLLLAFEAVLRLNAYLHYRHDERRRERARVLSFYQASVLVAVVPFLSLLPLTAFFCAGYYQRKWFGTPLFIAAWILVLGMIALASLLSHELEGTPRDKRHPADFGNLPSGFVTLVGCGFAALITTWLVRPLVIAPSKPEVVALCEPDEDHSIRVTVLITNHSDQLFPLDLSKAQVEFPTKDGGKKLADLEEPRKLGQDGSPPADILFRDNLASTKTPGFVPRRINQTLLIEPHKSREVNGSIGPKLATALNRGIKLETCVLTFPGSGLWT